MNSKERQYYPIIDVLRLIFALGVVSIHTMAFSSINENLRIATSMGICRIAVPFFFLVSGYFLYDRIQEKSEPKSTLKKLLILYIAWISIELITLFPTVLNYLNSPMFIIRRLLLVGVTGSLWYISSLILSIFLISKLLKNDNILFLIIIGMLLYLFGITGDTYYGLFNNILIDDYSSMFFLPQIGITESILFISLGAAINKYKLNKKFNFPGILAIISIIILLIETFILNKTGIAKDANMYLSTIIVAPLILIWALNYKKNNISSEFSKTCKEYSIGIYCSHQILMIWITILLPTLASNSMIKFILTLMLSIIVVTFIRKTKLKTLLLK